MLVQPLHTKLFPQASEKMKKKKKSTEEDAMKVLKRGLQVKKSCNVI